MEMSKQHKQLSIAGYAAIAIGYALVLYVLVKNINKKEH